MLSLQVERMSGQYPHLLNQMVAEGSGMVYVGKIRFSNSLARAALLFLSQCPVSIGERPREWPEWVGKEMAVICHHDHVGKWIHVSL